MTFQELARARYSVRSFKDMPIEEEKIIRLVLSVGYPKNPVPRKKIRKDIENVAKFLKDNKKYGELIKRDRLSFFFD